MNVLPFCFSRWQLNITFFPVTLLLLALMPSTCLGNFSSFCPLYRDPSSSSKHALKAYEIGCGCFAFGIHPEASPVFSFSYTNLSCHLSLAASLGPSPDLFLTVTVSSDFPRRIHIACLEGHSLCLLSLCPSSLTLTNASISLPKSTLSPSGKEDFCISVESIPALPTIRGENVIFRDIMQHHESCHFSGNWECRLNPVPLRHTWIAIFH